MAKKKTAAPSGSVQTVEKYAQSVADAMNLELVEVTLQKEARGRCLCVYVDKDGGLSLDDCEKYHKQLQPMLEEIDYDIMEVSSPGMDRPIKNLRDFEKNRGNVVEVKLFAPVNGSKLYRGTLEAMDDTTVTVQPPEGEAVTLERKGVAVIKPVIELDDEDFADVEFDETNSVDAEQDEE